MWTLWNEIYFITSPKGVSASKCEMGILLNLNLKQGIKVILYLHSFFKGFFLEFLGEFFWNFLDNFFGGMFMKEFFARNFLRGIFLEEFFERNILGGFFWRNFWGEEFFGRNHLFKVIWIWKGLICLSRFWFLSRFCLKSRGRKE